MRHSPFTEAYSRGVFDQLGPAPVRRRTQVRHPAAHPRSRPTAAAPSGAFALQGSVLTSTGSLADGYVVVDGPTIAEVGSGTPPLGVQVVRTGGVISPGLIDLHGHPEFNVFAAWEPPKLFANRYAWRASDLYHRLVRDPQNALITQLPPGTELRYAEVRALVGGVTAIQGASSTARSAGPEPLVRNVDLFVFGRHQARAMIDLPSASSRDVPRLQRILADIAAGTVTAFYLHLCEGRRGDPRSATEFTRFVDLGAATPATVLIHASALDAGQLHQVADAGCSLVWSPQSNLRLYGQTTLAAEAIRAGMPVGLGADWLPSGSTSLLAELQVARHALATQGLQVPAAELVAMVTSTAARIAGLQDQLGSIATGRPADLVVFERQHEDPYECIARATPSAVELVVIGGDISYGRADWFTELTGIAAPATPGPSPASSTVESLVAWGKPMVLDTGYSGGTGAVSGPTPSLTALRAALVAGYPQVGPIFA